ncbi:hypothetical protein Taro_007655, partial [Colocasia esculenta]|nr:hypothetical protein [Colocasia esculenta]
RKREEEQRKRKEEKEVERKKKKEEEEAEMKKEEEDHSKKKEEEEADNTRKEEEEEEIKRKQCQISPSSLSRRPEDSRYHKATKVNVFTSEPIYVDSQESTDTLPRGKKEERRDYVAREVLGVAKKSLIERFLNECIINEHVLQYMCTMFIVWTISVTLYYFVYYCMTSSFLLKMYTFLACSDLMFNSTLEGYENFLSFNDIWELLFARESESVIIDCYVNTYLFLPLEENPDIFFNFGYLGSALKGYVQSCRDDKSKHQHFDHAFRKLDRAPNEFDLLFSPMHVGTNHWALLVIHIKEKEFHVYDSLRNKDRRDIPQYVEELKRYLKGKHIDAEKWPLRYPDPCPQQGSGDDCGIFTCKYMECLARRDIQDLPFSQDDMPNVRAKFTLHFIKAYFNTQERS